MPAGAPTGGKACLATWARRYWTMHKERLRLVRPALQDAAHVRELQLRKKAALCSSLHEVQSRPHADLPTGCEGNVNGIAPELSATPSAGEKVGAPDLARAPQRGVANTWRRAEEAGRMSAVLGTSGVATGVETTS